MMGIVVACSILWGALPPATQVLSASGIDGGFCVVVGTFDGNLEAGLTDGGRVLVQGLALNESLALTARKNLYQKGLYPLASVVYVKSAVKLPYTDNVVNLLVADLDALGSKAPSMEEIDRVLGYGGTAYIKKFGIWEKHYIPIPQDINQYTHWKDDSTLSSFQNDHRVGIPNQVRWIGAPDIYFHNEERNGIRSFESERVAGGTWTGTVGGGTWARDAFSGVLLWREDYLGLESKYVSGSSSWAMNQKYLFGYSGRIGEGLVAYNIRTGKVEKKYQHTFTLRSQTDNRGKTIVNAWERTLLRIAHTLVHGENLVQIFGNKVWCVNQETGRVIWDYVSPGDSATIIRNGLIQDTVLALAVTQFEANTKGNAIFGPARGYFANFKQIVGLRLRDGKPLWTLDSLPDGQTLFHEMIGGGHGRCMLIYTNREPFRCLNVHTGKIEWSITDANGYGVGSYRGNAISLPEQKAIVFGDHNSYSTHDLFTGKITGSMGGVTNFGACPSTTVTPYYVLVNDKWIDRAFLQMVKAPANYRMVTIGSAACNYYPIIAYGSTYQIGGKCSCKRTIPSQSCSQRVPRVSVVPDNKRLVAANTTASTIPMEIALQSNARNSRIGNEWTTRCLGNYLPRSEKTCGWDEPKGDFQVMVSGEMLKHWSRMPAWTGLARQETSPVQSEDLTITAIVHEHRLTAKRGNHTIWNFIADSRITGDPVVDNGRVYFGAHDGYIYAVNSSDGTLVWKFLAAPDDMRMIAYGQVESCWPVFGVILQDGKLYAVAGRLATLDGGLHAYCLDAANGNPLWHVKNVSGYVDETVSHNSKKNLKECTDGAEMSDIRGWLIDMAINDQPYLENGLLKIPDWHIDINNPRDTIWFGDNLPIIGQIPRKNGKVQGMVNVTPLIRISHGSLWVIGARHETYRVGINDARGRCLLSATETGTKRIDIGLNDLPNGLYIIWVQIKGAKKFAKVKLLSVK